MQIFCVGGAVRDELLGRQVQDLDFVVLHTSEHEFQRRFPQARKVGREHPVFIFKGQQYTLSSATCIEDDLSTRDLTINALARDDQGKLYAHPQALDDLNLRVLRPVARQNFLADPLRVIRAARFKASLPEFAVHPDLEQVMCEVGALHLLNHLAPERVGQEIRQACQSPKPGHLLRVLARTHTLSPWLQEFASSRTQGSDQVFSDLESTARLMDEVAGRETRVWMALASGPWEVPCGHASPQDEYTEARALALGERFRLPKNLIRAGACAARWFEAGKTYPHLDARTCLDLLLNLHRDQVVDEFCDLIQTSAGLDIKERIQADLEAVLAVHLPPKWRNLGSRSGEHLRTLRCRVLQERPTTRPKQD